MLRIGITGGIGSGKTTVCQIFETMGIPVYYADERAKWLMTHSPALRTGITALFGGKAYQEDGTLNRKHISSIVFKEQAALQKLNALVHPAVFLDGEQWHQEQLDKGVPYTLKEAALLFEAGSAKFLDKIIVVSAPVETRIERVMKRDGVTKEEVRDRISKQLPEEEKVARADFVLVNDGSRSIIQQARAIHHELLVLARKKALEKQDH